MFWNGCHGLILFAWILMQVRCQISDNTPPTILLERNWQIPDTEPVGSQITQVHGSDNGKGPLIYGLEPLSPTIFNNDNNKKQQIQEKLPFRIDARTGTVYLNESLKGRAGENIRLYVTAFDGELQAKAEVYVNILNSSLIPSKVNILPFPKRPNLSRPPPGFLNYANIRPKIPSSSSSSSQSPSSTIAPQSSSLNEQSIYIETTNGQKFRPTLLHPVKTEIKQIPTVIDKNSSDKDNLTINNEQIKDNTSSDVTISIISVALICTILLVSIIFVFLLRKRCQDKKLKDGDDDIRKSSTGGVISQQDSGIDESTSNWRRIRVPSNQYESWQNDATTLQATRHQFSGFIPTDRWEFSRHRLKFFNILGEGAFGQVWKCEASEIDGNEGVITVAVKTLKENASEKEKMDLISEIKVMKMLKPHPNVVRLLGCCTDKEPIFLIMEYISKGKLQSYLRNSRAERYYHNMHGASKTLTSRDLTSFVYQVAKGMEFLTSHGIIHRDLAARNILINDEHTCKVADFGFARDITTSHVYEKKSEGRLPIRWMAPESLYDNIFSVKSDVWSFGVLIWEVVTLGSTPYPGMSAAEVMKQVRGGYRLEKPEHCRREIYNIMYYCWNKDPIERPSFSECVKLLEKLLMTETDYIQLERFPDHSYYNMVSLSGEKL